MLQIKIDILMKFHEQTSIKCSIIVRLIYVTCCMYLLVGIE